MARRPPTARPTHRSRRSAAPKRPPPLPRIVLEQTADRSPPRQRGFLHLERREYVARYPGGERSAPFVYDSVDRHALDAVVIVAHFRRDGRRHVFLRSAVRPAIRSRRKQHGKLEGRIEPGSLWELPAGLIEPSDRRRGGAKRSAQREIEEELGFRVRISQLRKLGPAVLPAPAIIAEQHVFFAVEVDPGARGEPTLDGSALERHGKIIAASLATALDWCSRGVIRDEKTELGLRRLHAEHGG